MMIGGVEPVNGQPARCSMSFTLRIQCENKTNAKIPSEKKPDSFESGLRYWPREADTITFQEGLLSPRATGGGGQCATRNLSRRYYDPRGCLAASTRAACQSCGERGLLYL